MPLTPPINSQKILRSKVRLPGDEHAEETKEAPPTDIKIEVEGQQPLPRHGGGRGKRRASSSSSVPPDAFRSYLRGLMVLEM